MKEVGAGAKCQLKKGLTLLQFPDMENVPAANRSNIFLVEREYRYGLTFTGHKLNLKSIAIFIAMNHCPKVTSFQAMFAETYYTS